ncbi:MAG: ABC transporter permease [Acidobacteria bacterium]|nr:ABC transporter permease [Acidobacteriota bacterium]
MRLLDVGRFAWRSLSGYRTRTLLMVLAVSIGVGAVVVLTSLGEGARRYVRNQFTSLGTNLVAVFPGRAETVGGAHGALIGRTPRDLTLEDALALRRIPAVKRVAPLNLGSAEVWWKGRSREVPVLGSTSELQEIRGFALSQGQFLPAEDPRRATPVCVIGSNVRKELFGARSSVGEWVRIADRRFRVVGVLAQQGQSLGLDTDELVIIPVASMQQLFNLPSLLRILVEARTREDVAAAQEQVRRVLRKRHDGEDDVTVVTQDAVLAAFDRILVALTLAVGGIASISLGVAGILIMNVMLIAVSQRTTEIGLLKAIGASPAQIRLLFFAEAAVLSLIGAAVGLVLGELGSFAIRQAYPVLPAFPPPWAVVAALATAVGTGIIFSLLPAQRAARLQPALALSRR